MFYKYQAIEDKTKYQDFLKIVGGLSNLFSDSPVPYLYYRVAEKIFCEAFNADNLSRSDVSLDAMKSGLGIGLKTFIRGNSKTFQKVAEFNQDRPLYNDLRDIELVKKVAQLRNERISFAENVYNISNSIYHCVVRDENKFLIFEEPMHKININKISDVKNNKSSVSFNDGVSDYSFLISKSTLTKRFTTKPIEYDFDVKILKDPLKELKVIFSRKDLTFDSTRKIKRTIYLPLYGKNQIVFEKSGLNQWNAGGRKRDLNEVYIPIPAEVHKKYPNFFPSRDKAFTIKLPNKQNMKSKICQDGGKALMSYSNKELGEWILRDILKLDEGTLLTYEKLQTIGIDSIRLDKISEDEFDINFSSLGKYEKFRQNF